MSERREKKRGEKREEKQRYSDFKEELDGRECVITLHNGVTVRGRIVEARPYWVKLVTTEGNVLYINKAYVALIRPL